MSAISSSSIMTGSPLPSVATQDFLTSFDLLTHSCTLLSLNDLLSLTTVSRLLHTVADSDQVWRPRLLSATQARHTVPPPQDEEADEKVATQTDQKTDDSTTAIRVTSSTIDTDSSAAPIIDEPKVVCTCTQHEPAYATTHCKTQYLTQFRCTAHTLTHCHHLAPPTPLLLVNRGPRSEGMRQMQRARRQAGASVPVSAGELHCVSAVCKCCVAGLAVAAKDFYDMRSEWAGSFTMTPLSIVPVPRAMRGGAAGGGGSGTRSDSALVVDVRYWHVGGYEDFDHRRFTIQWRGRARQQQQRQSSESSAAEHQSGSQSEPHSQPQPYQQHGSNSDEKEGPLSALAHLVSSGVRSAADSVRRAVRSIATRDASTSPTDGSGESAGVRAPETENSWHVVSMEPFCSGQSAFHSPANVIVTEALKYSRLPQTGRVRVRVGVQQPRQRVIVRRAVPINAVQRNQPRDEQQ